MLLLLHEWHGHAAARVFNPVGGCVWRGGCSVVLH